MSRWHHRFWARTLFSPSRYEIPSRKREARIPTRAGVMQLWGEASHASDSEERAFALVVLRLLGARGRAERPTQDPANRFAALRSITWTLNPPRFGQSSGPLSVEHYLEGALAAFDFLRTRYPYACIWVYGKCIGATGAMYLATHRVPSALIVKNIIDVPAVMRVRLERWLPAWMAARVNASVPDELNASRSATAARSPALFVVSDEDELAPPHLQENVFRAYGGSAHLLRVRGQHDERALSAEDEPRYAAALHRLWESARLPCVPPEEVAASSNARSTAR
jgi:hypothetical protein